MPFKHISLLRNTKLLWAVASLEKISLVLIFWVFLYCWKRCRVLGVVHQPHVEPLALAAWGRVPLGSSFCGSAACFGVLPKEVPVAPSPRWQRQPRADMEMWGGRPAGALGERDSDGELGVSLLKSRVALAAAGCVNPGVQAAAADESVWSCRALF